MGARESEAMRQARELVLVEGLTAYSAAKRTGISESAIYKATWYKEHVAGKTRKNGTLFK